MVLMHDMASECALQMYEVSLKYSNSYQDVERRTDGRKGKNNMCPDPSKGET